MSGQVDPSVTSESEERSGSWTEGEDKFLIDNYLTMTDNDVAKTLGRTVASVVARRHRLKLPGKNLKKARSQPERSRFVSSIDDAERRKFFETEVRSSASFRALFASLEQAELDHYVEKYVAFMMDPTIETMTMMEKDALHQLLINEIRINRFLAEEKTDKALAASQGRAPITRAKEIRECQEVIMKAQKSLNVEREQRLKNQSDSALTFTNLIRDMKNPMMRERVGREAAMLKFIAEATYNKHLGTHIISGKDQKFPVEEAFRPDQVPAKIDADFVPTIGEASEAGPPKSS